MMSKVERTTTDILVAEKLKDWIGSNNLRPGDRLPSEQKMCAELGVGRHTLREGIKRLSQMGIVESRTGSGTFVCGASLSRMQDYLDSYRQMGNIRVEDIYGVRSALESYSARMAALHANEEDLRFLREAVAKMEKCVGKDELYPQFVQSNLDFHMRVAASSGNVFLIAILESIKGLINKSIFNMDPTPQKEQFSLEGHRRILKAIEARDSELASREMLEHLTGMSIKNRPRPETRSAPKDGKAAPPAKIAAGDGDRE